MKNFLQIVFGSCLGVIAAFAVVLLVIANLGGGESKNTKPKANSILYLKLEGEITDRAYTDPFRNAGFFGALSGDVVSKPTLGLFDIQQVFRHAKTDDHIKGILLNVDGVTAGSASILQIRDYIKDFRSKGKFVYVYSNGPTQKTFLLGAAADKLYLNPNAYCEFDGLVAENMFFTGLLEKAGVKPMIFYAGQFKSATEPFRLKEMSPQNELQLSELLNDIYSEYMDALSVDTKLSREQLRSLADSLRVTEAEDALSAGLADGLKYEDELLDDLRKKLGYKKSDPLNLVTYTDYKSQIKEDESSSDNQVAVVFAEGDISDGTSEPGSIGGETYMHLIRDIRKNLDKNKTKALVLRVNSGGGSAFASEQIWRELKLLQEKIPVVVSMGNVAASGGYYIACASNKIIAEPITVTGSIGVFSMLFNTQQLFNDKAGITFDRVQTNPHADFGSGVREWDELEMQTMQRGVDNTYTLFMKRVSDVRKMDTAAVAELAQGRIYSGSDALALGLVDELGGLDLAIKRAKELAKIKEAKTVFYPEEVSAFDQFMKSLTGKDDEELDLVKILGKDYLWYKEIRKLQSYEAPQAKLPYTIVFK